MRSLGPKCFASMVPPPRCTPPPEERLSSRTPAPTAAGFPSSWSQGLDIRGDLAEDVFKAVKNTGYRLPWDATEPRLLPLLDGASPEDEMAVRLSHVPARVRVGI